MSAMGPTERIEQMTLEEFIREYSREPFELVQGERRPLMPPVMLHQLTIRALFLLLYGFCQPRQLGEVVFELPFVETYSSDWVKGSRTPDLMFFSAAKWAQYTAETADWEKKPSLLAPDLAVEVVSPNDNYSEIEDKVDEYLERGVLLIWVFDPLRKRVSVYQGERHIRLGRDGILTGGDVLPDFELKLAEFFEGIER